MTSVGDTPVTATPRAEILLVDDQPDDLRLLSEILGAAGFLPRPAGDGELALRSARAKPPALVLLDIRLPGLDGLEVCRRLKADPLTAEIPVLFISALHDDYEKGRAFEAGGVDYLTKPLQKEEVLARVRTHLAIVESRELLARERDRARQYLEIAGVMIVALDRLGNVSTINRKACEVLGVTAAEVVGQSWFERFLPPDEREQVREVFAQLIAGELQIVEHHENRVLTKRGEERLIAWHNAVVRDDTGAITGTLGSGEDITGSREAAAALRRSEARLRAVLDATPFPVALVDTQDDRIEFWSRSAHALFGHTAPTAAEWYQIAYPDPEYRREVIARWKPALEQARRSERAVNTGEHRVTCHDGSVRICELHAAFLADGLIVTFNDVTERKRTEEQLRISEAQLSNALQMGRAGHWEYDVDLDRFTFNDNFYRIFRTTAAVVGGYQMSSADYARRFCHPDDAALVAREVQAVIESSDPSYGRELEHRILYADGEVGTISVRFFVIKDARGRTVKTFGLNQDVTERRQLQAQLAQSDRLSTMGTLAAGVAHEINNPLSYVLYNIESLAEDLPRLTDAFRRCHAALCTQLGIEAVAELLGSANATVSPGMLDDVVTRFRDALSGALRIKAIARGLGTFSRVERTEVAPIDVHHAAEHAITMAANEIRFRARLVKDFGQVPMVLGSEGKLAQVFLNLLINAAQAIDEGAVEQNEIRVQTWAEDDHVFIAVSDTGKGIAAEHQIQVFEPFFTTKSVGAGTGIGLSICQRIIKEFGGEISFTSEVSKGSRFVVQLARVPSGWATVEEEVPKQAARPEVRGRILVVDDEAEIRAIMRRLLGPEHEVITCSSGAEAQALLENDRRFDLILCDLMMPKMSGMALHAWLAERAPSLAGQVVFITGGAFTPGASEYLAKVGNLRVEKPFDATEFRKTADELIVAAQARHQV